MKVGEFIRGFYGLLAPEIKTVEIVENVDGKLKHLYSGNITDERWIKTDILTANIRVWSIITRPSKSKKIYIVVENP